MLTHLNRDLSLIYIRVLCSSRKSQTSNYILFFFHLTSLTLVGLFAIVFCAPSRTPHWRVREQGQQLVRISPNQKVNLFWIYVHYFINMMKSLFFFTLYNMIRFRISFRLNWKHNGTLSCDNFAIILNPSTRYSSGAIQQKLETRQNSIKPNSKVCTIGRTKIESAIKKFFVVRSIRGGKY